jgi:hypothetical protein
VADLNLRIDRDGYQPPEEPKKVIREEASVPSEIDDFFEMFAEEIVGVKKQPQKQVRQPQVRPRTRRVEQAQPQPVLQEEVFVPAQPQRERNYIDRSADRLSDFIGETGGATQLNEVEERFHILEAEISKIRQMTKAHFPGNQGNTIVSGIGQGGDGQSPGSGAVWLWDLNDVEIGTPMNGVYPDITDGSVLVYDAATDKWKPGDGGGPGEHESNLQTGGVIQKDGGLTDNSGELIIKQDAAGAGGDLKLENSSGATFVSLYASSGRIANIHRLSDTPSLELGQCGPSGSRLPVINLDNGAPNGTNTAPRLTFLNTHTQTPQADGLGNLRYNITIEAGTQTSMRINRGTNNGGWTSLYIEGKTVNYDPSAAGTNFNSTNDPKRYPLINLYRSTDNNAGHVADAINYRGRTDSQYYLQTKESVQALIDAGGGGVGFEFSGLVNVRMATSSGNQPTHTGDLTDPTPGAFYINTTAGTAYNADDVTGAGSWIGIAGLDISQDQLIIWSETAQRWFAGAVEDNSSFLKINGTNNMLECLNVVLNTPAENASNAALTIRKQGDSQARTTIYAGGSMDVGGTIKLTSNIIPATTETGKVGTTDSLFSEVNTVKIITTQTSVMAGINTTYSGAYNLGEDGTRWGVVYAQAVNCDSTSTMANINPVTLNTGSIGTADKRWANVYAQNINSNSTASLNEVTVSGDIVPNSTAARSIGSSNKRFKEAYINAIETTNKSVMGAIWPKSDGGYSFGSDTVRWNTLFANSLNLSGGSITNSGTFTQNGDSTLTRLTVNTQAQFNIAVKTTKNFEATGTNSKLQFTGASDSAEIDVSGQKNKSLYFYATDGSGGSGALNKCFSISYDENESLRPLKVNSIVLENLTGRSKITGTIQEGTMALMNNQIWVFIANGWYKLEMTGGTPPQ